MNINKDAPGHWRTTTDLFYGDLTLKALFGWIPKIKTFLVCCHVCLRDFVLLSSAGCYEIIMELS